MSSRNLRSFVGLGLALTFGFALSAQAADAERGKKLAYTCLGCHGIANYKNVYPTYNVPKLVGQHPESIVVALKAYKTRERSHATMHVQAASLSDAAMADIAAYIAGQAITKGAEPVGTAPEKVGQLCVACHGTDGVGITAEYPNIGGQHADYLLRALTDYKTGARKNAVMSTFMATLTAGDIAEIAEYYSRQQPALETVARRTGFWSSR